MQVGEYVTVSTEIRKVGAWSPDGVDSHEAELLRGRVVYIHPKQRYFTVEFTFGENKLLESFFFSHTEEDNGYENDGHHEYKRRSWKNRNSREYCGSLGKALWQKGFDY